MVKNPASKWPQSRRPTDQKAPQIMAKTMKIGTSAQRDQSGWTTQVTSKAKKDLGRKLERIQKNRKKLQIKLEDRPEIKRSPLPRKNQH